MEYSIESDNIINDLNLILLNIPTDLPVIEQVRWLYIKCGELFSYDYRIAYNTDYARAPIDFSKDYISRYQTCTQISYLFNIMLNNIKGCNSQIITRKGQFRGITEFEHVANEVILSTGEKLILDLTLDLYLIQSGCQTKQFGFTSDITNSHDIIPLKECREMDEKLGLIKRNEYTDIKIKELAASFDSKDFSNMKTNEIIEYKISKISPIIPSFYGYHEGKQFINKLFIELLKSDYKEYNLYRQRREEETDIITCFKIKDLWYVYDQRLGLLKTSSDSINHMLNCGWKTKSESLLDELYGNSDIEKKYRL